MKHASFLHGLRYYTFTLVPIVSSPRPHQSCECGTAPRRHPRVFSSRRWPRDSCLTIKSACSLEMDVALGHLHLCPVSCSNSFDGAIPHVLSTVWDLLQFPMALLVVSTRGCFFLSIFTLLRNKSMCQDYWHYFDSKFLTSPSWKFMLFLIIIFSTFFLIEGITLLL
jgi:hypothetical protein